MTTDTFQATLLATLAARIATLDAVETSKVVPLRRPKGEV